MKSDKKKHDYSLLKIVSIPLLIMALILGISRIIYTNSKNFDTLRESKLKASSTVDLTSLAINSNVNHEHVWASGYDSNQHYEFCTICKELGINNRRNVQNHSFGPEQWTYGGRTTERCDPTNSYRKTCSCGYSVASIDPHPSVSEVNPTYPERHVHYRSCPTCEWWYDSQRCHDSNGNILGCKRAGTCSDCKTVVKNTYHYIYEGICLDCGKKFFTINPAIVTYSGNTATVKWSLVAESGVTFDHAIPISSNRNINWTSYTRDFTKSGNTYTFTYVLQLNTNAVRTANLYFGDMASRCRSE